MSKIKNKNRFSEFFKTKEDADRFFETNEQWKEATQKHWHEVDEAIKSGDFEIIKENGEKLNQSLLLFRQRNPHLFS